MNQKIKPGLVTSYNLRTEKNGSILEEVDRRVMKSTSKEVNKYERKHQERNKLAQYGTDSRFLLTANFKFT